MVVRTHSELDLTDQHVINKFFKEEKPEYVFPSECRNNFNRAVTQNHLQSRYHIRNTVFIGYLSYQQHGFSMVRVVLI